MTIRKKIFFVFIFFFILFASVEIVGYFFTYKFNINVARFGVPMLVDADNILKDEKLFWKFKPSNRFRSAWECAGEIKINSAGWRDSEFKLNKPKNLKRIVCIGDSSTFGYRRKDDEVFANILEKKLNEMKLYGYDWEVQNYGVPGYTFHQGRVALFDYALKYKPDYVISMFGKNDSREMPVSDDEYKVRINFFTKYEIYLQKSYTYRILMKGIFYLSQKRQEQKKLKPRVSVEKFQQILEEINQVSKKENFIYIPMTATYNPEFIDTLFAQKIEQYNRCLRVVAKKNNINYIDISDEFYKLFKEKNKNYIWDACHPDAEGNIYIANRIIDKIRELKVR